MKKAVIIILAIGLLGALGCVGVLWALRPGGGGSTQVAPDSIESGGPAAIRLELSVWGAGGSIKGRYTDISMHYQLVGQEGYTILQPKLISHEEKREVYEFTIRPYPKGTSGTLEYYFELKLDGHYSRIGGIKTIELRH